MPRLGVRHWSSGEGSAAAWVQWGVCVVCEMFKVLLWLERVLGLGCGFRGTEILDERQVLVGVASLIHLSVFGSIFSQARGCNASISQLYVSQSTPYRFLHNVPSDALTSHPSFNSSSSPASIAHTHSIAPSPPISGGAHRVRTPFCG